MSNTVLNFADMGSFISKNLAGIFATGIVLSLSILLRSLRVGRASKLPPSPGGLPWIGQALEIPTTHSHLYYTELHKKLGDIYSLTAIGQKFVVLNTYEAAFEILGRHGAVHCDRPPNPYWTRFLGLENLITIMNVDQDWKEGRRLFQLVFNKESARASYSKGVAAQASRYVLASIEQVQDKDNKLDLALHKTILQSAYGLKLEDGDPILTNALQATEVASVSLLPTKHLVNLFPSLQHLPSWVPFQTWRIEAKEARKVLDPLTETPWQRFLANNSEGTASESVALRIIAEQNPANAHLLPILAGTNCASSRRATKILAGAETTLVVCRTFVLAMLLHPEVQRKAQEELDRVIGHERLPKIDDLSDLPYIDAVVKEVLRWQPVGPISVPRRTRKDDLYGDYLIPQGTIVVQNNWAISRDDRVYSNPDSFDPDRWLVADPPRDSRLWSFGMGRRICPGMAYAELAYTTFIMTLLSSVNVLPALDKDGREEYINPSVPTTGRLVK
ncbi:cytochrome P450 [Clavulina sp. PMI_390]|nr:cytochrome P450 [Clavulina sp. PMI_390]